MAKFPINSIVTQHSTSYAYRIIDIQGNEYELQQVKPTLSTITFTYDIPDLERLCYLKSAIRRH